MQVVHLPKTIDNDYRGIDFTFGFFTAVDVMAKELQNLRADAIATSATSSSRRWAARPAGSRTASRSPARPTSCSPSRTSTDDMLVEEEIRIRRPAPPGANAAVARRARRSHRRTDPHARAARTSTTARSCSPRASPSCCPESLPPRPAARRARPHLARHASISASWSPGSWPTVRAADRPQEEGDRPAARLRVALRAAARVRRHARQPARHRRLPRARRGRTSTATWSASPGQLDLLYVPFRDLVDPETLNTEVRFIRPAATSTAWRASSRRASSGCGARCRGPGRGRCRRRSHLQSPARLPRTNRAPGARHAHRLPAAATPERRYGRSPNDRHALGRLEVVAF